LRYCKPDPILFFCPAGGAIASIDFIYAGYIKEDALKGSTLNINGSFGPIGVTTLTDPKTREIVGVTVGWSLGVPLGASASLCTTGTISTEYSLDESLAHDPFLFGW
jgi:hypothetical protein